MRRIGWSTALLASLASCAAPTRAPPAPPPPPLRIEPPAPPPAAPPPTQDWRDIALTPGDWSYAADASGSEARFGAATAELTLRCDAQRRRLLLRRTGTAAALVVRTSFGRRSLPAGAVLPASDPLLDQIAFSRGRFTVEAEDAPMLVLPAWPEPARVIEDCRA